jgi:two-component system, LuxR family, response regulator FixJ
MTESVRKISTRHGARLGKSLASSTQRMSVIVLDDDVSVCRALKTQLEILGFDVRVFHSSAELLETEIPRHACLLLDVYLPGMSGIELCRHLIATGIYVPTILMSGRDDAETRRRMLDAQPIASLFKPFGQAALLRAIRRAAREGVHDLGC